MFLQHLSHDWYDLLRDEFEKPYFSLLSGKVSLSYNESTTFPPQELIFNALNLCPFSKIKVVIIGQDPYHGPQQANGLSFSVNNGVKQPPSLKNIFKELKNDIPGFEMPLTGNLESWARQGVLMLNAVLSVREASPGSHRSFGWERFTDHIIQLVSEQKEHVVFMLWGNFAINKKELINSDKHLVLTSAHPSPLARGAFFGSRHFSKANNYLVQNGLTPINWNLV